MMNKQIITPIIIITQLKYECPVANESQQIHSFLGVIHTPTLLSRSITKYNQYSKYSCEY